MMLLIQVLGSFVLLSAAVVSVVVWRWFNPRYLVGVPVIGWDSILGFSLPFVTSPKNGKYDSHFAMLSYLESRVEKLLQFSFVGHIAFMTNDQHVAKYLLENVNGKGFFHRGDPTITFRNVFNLDTNSEWRKRRNAFRHPFSVNNLRHFQDEVAKVVNKACAIVDKAAESDSILNIDVIFGQLTIDVICEVAFQLDIKALDNSKIFQDLHHDIRDRFEYFWIALLPFASLIYQLPLHGAKTYRRAKLNCSEFGRYILNHLRNLRKEGVELNPYGLGHTLLDFMEQDASITERDIIEEIVTLFIAGHETTAHTLSWVIYALAKHPAIQERCQREIDQWFVSGEHKPPSSSAVLPPYVEAVIKESMRKYPVAIRGSMRQVPKEGFTIPKEVLNASAREGITYANDIRLPGSSWIHVYAFAVQNDKRVWGEDAAEFKPERWLNTPENPANPLAAPSVYSGAAANTAGGVGFTPFSIGLRNCLGMNLSMMEIRVTAAEMLRRYTFTLADPTMVDETIAMETVFTLRPHNMLPVRVQKRTF